MAEKKKETKVEEKEKKNKPKKVKKTEKYEEVAKKEKEVRTDSYFDGGVLELIGWRLLAGLITTITLGIGAPWAQCMLYSWRLKHTVYNGKRLKFEGTGGDLFVQMFKWFFFTIITLGIYSFFVPVKKAKWVLSNIHFEDEEHSKEDSFFDGKTLGFIGINILTKLITILSLGLLYPFAECIKLRWIIKHSIINRKKLAFDGTGIRLFGKYLLWDLLTIITFGIFGLWLPIVTWKWETKNIHIKKVGEEDKKDRSALLVIPLIIVIVTGVVMLLSTIDFEPYLTEIKGLYTQFEEDGFILRNMFETLSESNLFKNKDTVSEKVSTPAFDDYEEEKDEEVVVVTPPAKTSVSVGGYTLQFGTYKGQVVQGVWDEETMTSTARYSDVILVLSEKTISINGDSGSYYISGGNIVWKGESYYLEVAGNNQIRYMAENCPVLTYQGY